MTRHTSLLVVMAATSAWLHVGTVCGENSPIGDAVPGKQVSQSAKVWFRGMGVGKMGVPINYWIYLPDEYEQQDTLPLLLFLHDEEQRSNHDMEMIKTIGIPRLIDSGHDYPAIVVSPQCYERSYWNPHELANLIEVLCSNLKVDRTRVYCTGVGMGGTGTWSLLAAYPGLIAAAAPVGGEGQLRTAPMMRDTPIWAFRDPPRIERSDSIMAMVETIRNTGSANIRFTSNSDFDHRFVTEPYSDYPELFQWLLSHQRSQ